MKKKTVTPAQHLRKQAEEKLKTKQQGTHVQLSEAEMLKLIHELQVHQIELELQNDELIQAKEQIETAAEKYTDLYDFAPTGYFTLNTEDEIIDLNLAGAGLLGKTRSQLRNKHFALYVSHETKPDFHLFIEKTYNSTTTQSCEIALLTETEWLIYVYLTGIITENGQHCLLTAIDISARKQAEKETLLAKQKIEISENRFKLAVAAGLLGIWDWDVVNNEMIWDDRMFELYGITKDVFPNNIDAWTNGLHPDDKQLALDECNAALSGHKDFNTTFRVIHPDGKVLHIRANGLVIRNNDGIPLRMLGINKDITESKLLQEQLIVAKEKAEESDRLKTAFLHNMSHEIRTPMNAISGFSQLLMRDYGQEEKLAKYIKIIDEGSNDLLHIIDDILDISRLDSGQLSFKMAECDLSVLFEEITSQFSEYQQRVNKTHISFSMKTLCGNKNPIIITDKRKLKQIFVNLITNAFKFTNQGSIEGGCKLENNTLMFFVSDTGIGIPADKQNFVFERFAQLKQDKTQTIPGTGLGLSITKGLLRLLGGEIYLESVPDKGSTFSFTIPGKLKYTLPKKSFDSEEQTVFQFSGKTILIVEDELNSAKYLKALLQNTGAIILMADNGKDAISLAKNQPVDLVLLDIQLPDMDGYETLKQIRQQKPDCKIIAQTAFATMGDKQKAFESGFNDYISKPIMANLLFQMINKHLTLN